MENEKKNSAYFLCEICQTGHAKIVKGGIYNNERKLWLVCEKCKHDINDTRIIQR